MGYHLYYFYEDDEKLARVLAKFFMEGLRKFEYCIWIPRAGITEDRAMNLLKKYIPEIEDYMLKDQMYIEPFDSWSLTEEENFDAEALQRKWMDKYNEVMRRGFVTMRAACDSSSVLKTHWNELIDFEAKMNETINDLSCVTVCAYKGKLLKPTEIQGILKNHFCPLTPSP